MKSILILLCALIAGSAYAEKKQEQSKKVLVVFSSEDKITLKEGNTHDTGFFLQELIVPLRMLKEKGYEPVYAAPKAGKPIIDMVSRVYWFDEAKTQRAPWFSTEQEFTEMLSYCIDEGLCKKEGRIGALDLAPLSSLLGRLDEFAAVLFPGGHAPMEDLWKDKDVAQLLRHFHEKAKPTALICHAPIALLSAMERPEAYIEALTAGKLEYAKKIASDWIYKDYVMTSFSTKEEQQEEPGQDDVLGGHVRFYPDEALDGAMDKGRVLVRAQKWQSNALRFRELITGSNPFSDKRFGELLIEALEGN